jgi:CcmD family protein
VTYLFAAYSAIWIILFWYIYSLSRRQRQLETDLARMVKKVGGISKG